MIPSLLSMVCTNRTDGPLHYLAGAAAGAACTPGFCNRKMSGILSSETSATTFELSA